MDCKRFLSRASLAVLVVASALAISLHARAAGIVDPIPCEDSQALSQKLITDVCWECIFPIKVAGIPISSSGNSGVPAGAASDNLCFCDTAGPPSPGVTMSMWQPARLIEITRAPGCFSALNGANMGFDKKFIGSSSDANGKGIGGSFYHYRYYAFPVLQLLELFNVPGCLVDDALDFDVMFFSEVDATWNNSELAFFTSPEAAMVANPVASAACVADSIAAAAGHPISQLFWCSGQWGNMYPFSGHHSGNFSLMRETSLLSARLVSALHRRGLARKTMGNDALCKAKIYPTMPKDMYKMATYHPRPEANKAHVIGEPTFMWAAGRTIPGKENTPIYMLFRWQDCCSL